jgi:hypothetical protein
MLLVLRVVQPQPSLVVWVVACRVRYQQSQVNSCLFSLVVLPARMRWVGMVAVRELRQAWVAVEQPTYVEVMKL